MEENSNASSEPVYDSELEDEVYVDQQDVIQEVEVKESDRDHLDLDEDMDDTAQSEAETSTTNEPDDSKVAFMGHTDSVYSVALNGTNQVLATGGGDDKAILWNVATGAPLFELQGHTDTISQVSFNSDGSLVASGSYDGSVKIWNAQTGQLVHTLECPGESVDTICWHPKNPILAGTQTGNVWMWLATTGSFLQLFSGHKAPVCAAVFTLDEKQVVTASEDATLRVWAPKTGQNVFTVQGHGFHEAPITSLTLHPTHHNVVGTTAVDGSVVLTNISAGKPVGGHKQHTASAESLSFCTTLPYMATGGMDKQVLVYDLNTLQTRSNMTHEEGVVKVAWHPTQPLLFSASLDKTVRLWDGRTASSVKVWRGHTNNILDMKLSSDGSFAITGADDHAALLFTIQ